MLDALTHENELFASFGRERLSQFVNGWTPYPNQRSLAFTCALAATPDSQDKYEFKSWASAADKILAMSTEASQSDFDRLCLSGQRYFQYDDCYRKFGLKCYRYGESRIFDVRLDQNSFSEFCEKYNLTNGLDPVLDDKDYLFTSRADLIVGIMEEYNSILGEQPHLDNSRYDKIMVIDKIVQFTQLWEIELGLKLDLEFLKQLLNHISKVMVFPIGKRCARFTQELLMPRSKQNKKLYFAYGSNMDQEQMHKRCPKSTVFGLTSLANFQFFINCRGVASIRPSLGETCHGLLWNISDHDWDALDWYEGVQSNFYRRVTTKIQVDLAKPYPAVDGVLTDCEIYVARDTAEGEPRHGYLEKVVDGAKQAAADGMKYLTNKKHSDDFCWDDACDTVKRGSTLWIDELNLWRRGE